jgi:predicted Zn-dependent protease
MRLVLVAMLVSTASLGFELKTDPSGDVVRWEGPVRLVVDATLDARLDAPGALGAVRAAVQTWRASGVDVSVEAGDAAAADVTVGLTVIDGAWPYDDDVMAVTLLELDETTHHIVGAHIVLNAAQNRFKVLPADSVRGGGFVDVQNTVTHELGHALGLAHEPDHPEAVMFPMAFDGDIDKRSLSQDDLQAIDVLYPARAAGVDAQQVGCSTAATSAFTLAVLLALARRRRTRKPSVDRPT